MAAGLTFSPPTMPQPGRPGEASLGPSQRALQILALHLPRILGQRAVSPQSLLVPQAGGAAPGGGLGGGALSPEAAVLQTLLRTAGPTPAPAPSFALPTPSPVAPELPPLAPSVAPVPAAAAPEWPAPPDLMMGDVPAQGFGRGPEAPGDLQAALEDLVKRLQMGAPPPGPGIILGEGAPAPTPEPPPPTWAKGSAPVTPAPVTPTAPPSDYSTGPPTASPKGAPLEGDWINWLMRMGGGGGLT